MMSDESKTEASNVSNQDKLALLMQLSGHPLRFLREGREIGFKSIGRFIRIVILFCITNLALLGYSIYKLNVGVCFLVIILGLFCTIYAGRRAYYGIYIDLARFIYQNVSSVFRKICDQIIDQVSNIGGKLSKNVKIEKIVDINAIITGALGKSPRLICARISFILKRIPIIGMLADMPNIISSEGKEQAANLLYQKIDQYVEGSIFSRNKIYWIFWLLPLNVIIPLLFLL